MTDKYTPEVSATHIVNRMTSLINSGTPTPIKKQWIVNGFGTLWNRRITEVIDFDNGIIYALEKGYIKESGIEMFELTLTVQQSIHNIDFTGSIGLQDQLFKLTHLQNSVLLMETNKDNDIGCGSCFVTNGGVLVTCKHNIEVDRFKVFMNPQIPVEHTNFEIRCHPARDVAILIPTSREITQLARSLRPLDIEDQTLQIGEDLITMGFPSIPLRLTQLLVDRGVFQNYTVDYFGNEYLTISNGISGGFSGGPIISLNGKVVGIITESTELNSDSKGTSPAQNNFGHGTPSRYILEII